MCILNSFIGPENRGILLSTIVTLDEIMSKSIVVNYEPDGPEMLICMYTYLMKLEQNNLAVFRPSNRYLFIIQ